jgi:hypothetical protein
MWAETETIEGGVKFARLRLQKKHSRCWGRHAISHRVYAKLQNSKNTQRLSKTQHEICTLLGFHAEPNCSSVPTFRDNLSVPSSTVKHSTSRPSFPDCFTPEDGTDRLSRTSLRNYNSAPRKIPKDLICIATEASNHTSLTQTMLPVKWWACWLVMKNVQ